MAFSAGPYGAALADGSEYDGSYAERVSEEQLMDFHRQRLQVMDLLMEAVLPGTPMRVCIRDCLNNTGQA